MLKAKQEIVPEPDPFAGAQPVAGLEHLGRAIVDMHGMPSGSPANFEATRNITAVPADPADIAATVAKLKKEFPA